jgi:hypothetical protein
MNVRRDGQLILWMGRIRARNGYQDLYFVAFGVCHW